MVGNMKTAIAIPTFNACSGDWERILQAIDEQNFAPDFKLIVDSESSDETCTAARQHGWNCIKIRKSKFKHGGVRRKIVKLLFRKKFDVVIFMTQDVLLSSPDSLRQLVTFLQEENLAGCYGRQRSENCGSLHRWQRETCYPAESCIKNKEQISELGLMTAFFSDAFAAWDIGKIMKYGAFPDAQFGEDTLLAGKLILNGEAVGYCAGAECLHEHQDDWKTLWTRGWQVGELHKKESWLLKEFGAPSVTRKNRKRHPLPFKAWLSFAIKSFGYLSGRFFS